MQDPFRQRGLSWADAVTGFRAWGVRRGVIRIFAPGRPPRGVPHGPADARDRCCALRRPMGGMHAGLLTLLRRLSLREAVVLGCVLQYPEGLLGCSLPRGQCTNVQATALAGDFGATEPVLRMFIVR